MAMVGDELFEVRMILSHFDEVKIETDSELLLTMLRKAVTETYAEYKKERAKK